MAGGIGRGVAAGASPVVADGLAVRVEAQGLARVQGVASVVDSHPFCAGLAPSVRAAIAGCAHESSFAPGAVLFRASAPADRCYLVRDGEVALELEVPGRGAMALDTVRENELLGWSWLVPPYRHLATARALTGTRVLEIDGARLRARAEADPGLGFALLGAVSHAMFERVQAYRVQLADLYECVRQRREPVPPGRPVL